MRASIHANGAEIPVISKGDENDYIALIESFRNNNPEFKRVEFDSFKHEAGTNAFTLSPQKWIFSTKAVGLGSTLGRYGDMYPHIMKGINTPGQELKRGGVAAFTEPRGALSHLAFPALAR